MDSSSLSVDHLIVLVARFSLACFFVPSALGKLANKRQFAQGLLEYQILPEQIARIFASVLPWVELVLGIALVLGVALPIAGILSISLLASFIIAITINLYRNRTIECNCYGISGTTQISWGSVVRNILLILLSILVVYFDQNILDFESWIVSSRVDFLIVTDIGLAALFIVLTAFCFITIQLIEWAIYVHYRVSILKSKSNI